MLDTTFNAPKIEATDYTPLPDDMYQVELLDIESKMNESFESKKARATNPALAPVMEPILSFTFTVLDDSIIVNGKAENVRGRNIWMNFVHAYLYIGKSGKNDLYKIVEALQGSSLTQEQEAYGISGTALNALIGKQCRVVTKQVTKNGKTYMDVDNLLPAKAPLSPLTAQEKVDATPKPKDEAAEAAADASYEAVTE